MNVEELKDVKTKYLAKDILYFDQIDSTQDEARRLIMNNKAKNGTIIIADKQIMGKGTHGRQWFTGNGKNIAFSFILFPHCNINQISELTVIIARSMITILKNLYNIELFIKEPNDIMYDNKKIGGILTQSNTKNELIKYIIIGIGINVNQLEFPGEIETIATSLKKEFPNINFKKEDIIKTFCEHFEKQFEKLI